MRTALGPRDGLCGAARGRARQGLTAASRGPGDCGQISIMLLSAGCNPSAKVPNSDTSGFRQQRSNANTRVVLVEPTDPASLGRKYRRPLGSV